MAKVLLTGATGYIGSHCLLELAQAGYEFISLDSHIRSSPEILGRLEEITGQTIRHYAVDLCDAEGLAQVFLAEPEITAVIHFAALKSVPESVAQPLRYYQNNLMGLCQLLEQMQKHGVKQLIFSSSCSVYGNVEQLPVDEQTPIGRAESPYARGKQMSEEIIRDFLQAYPEQQAILLRYFNPAGAHPSGLLGEFPQKQSYNLVPILMEVAMGWRDEFQVFGQDYATRDGSCIRDYIHIMDLAKAHRLALSYLQDGRNEERLEIFNIGIGEGVTVLEAIRATEAATQQPLNYRLAPARAGDVAAIYANYQKAKDRLGWTPSYDIGDIMQSAWRWQQVLAAIKEKNEVH